MTTTPNPLDKYVEDDVFSTILRWSLYFGAFFQLACIMASIFMSSQGNKKDGETLEDSKSIGCDAQPNNRRLHKLRKQEKKKRR
ncbi:hypothetical protein FF38_09515 [Lucilia cuprina]|uniref:Protein anon-73B1 n=1 Tax=Lucilia cuprina TaxID=7375 RepID=A0A0L0CF04_LUCCU|nr:anon-73B1-like [Lucilia cuprina]KNC30069.1 hypothetical protein FF38_09515 [Lucilia cuprina]